MPEYPTSGGSRAVFLSYAREDTDATRRIAEALRGQGVEVWFDLSELRGGDAWDRKIRRQIKECALFLAIISRHTDTRLEGYFRREWKLANGRRYDEAIAQRRRYLALQSRNSQGNYQQSNLQSRASLGLLHYAATGSTREKEEFLAGLSTAESNSDEVNGLRKYWAARHGDLDEAIRLDRGTDPNVMSAIAIWWRLSEGRQRHSADQRSRDET